MEDVYHRRSGDYEYAFQNPNHLYQAETMPPCRFALTTTSRIPAKPLFQARRRFSSACHCSFSKERDVARVIYRLCVVCESFPQTRPARITTEQMWVNWVDGFYLALTIDNPLLYIGRRDLEGFGNFCIWELLSNMLESKGSECQ